MHEIVSFITKNASEIITIFLTIIGWTLALYQFHKQHTKNLILQQENVKKELQIKTAEEAIKLLSNVRSALIKITGFIAGFNLEIVAAKHSHLLNEKFNYPSKMLFELHNKFNNDSLEFLYYFESREVILNKFSSMKNDFRDKYNEVNDDSIKLFNFLIESFLIEITKPSQIEKMDYEKYNSIVKQLESNMFDLHAYIFDFIVELQNVFLSDLFNYKIPTRKPLDSKIKVLSPESSN